MDYGYMSMGGQRVPIRNNTSTGYGGQQQMPGLAYSPESIRRQQMDEERRRRSEKQNSIQSVIGAMFGGGQQAPAQRGGAQGMGGPSSSEFGALNNRRPAGPGTPDYHREIPMGGTPGVWAIRNDEIYGPKHDRWRSPGGQTRRDWRQRVFRGR